MCIELLISTRYLDADKEFYTSVEDYFDICDAYNVQLSAWDLLYEHESEEIEQWLSKATDELIALSNKLKRMLKQKIKEIILSQ